MPDSTAFVPHDHGPCLEGSLATAERMAHEAGARFTPVRRQVLEILLSEHRAFGAYEVLDRLAAQGHGRQPPLAYRALDFLVDLGLVHRVRGLNAFAACGHPGTAHAPVFLICKGCNAVAEAPAEPMAAPLADLAGAHGFRVDSASIEALGMCPACQTEGR